jgi:hypothetical protein
MRAQAVTVWPVDTTRATFVVLQQVADERVRQAGLGYTREHDDEHGRGHLLDLAAAKVRGARHIVSGTLADRRERMVQAAALLVAAIERHDRTHA